ncbi:uncharacterized protein LOC106163401 [Lingula anatina]|uniref:Uncharacterized protein LOC106163401 n=1 Tax=Lingula anatina TaxID=7574 RepID=A0A1S3IG30_LINAN|nr:uncharacterized protein LOC106163401 [Lingula anatina]|eukprot:XP_013396429.1 uncharacterized protein LOC106163401 [Lingula anatina]
MDKTIVFLCVIGVILLTIGESEGRRFRVRIRTYRGGSYSGGSSSSDDTDLALILGLSIGIPVGIIFLVVATICCIACCSVCFESCCGKKKPEEDKAVENNNAMFAAFETEANGGPGIHEPGVHLTGSDTAYFSNNSQQQNSYWTHDQPPAYGDASFYPSQPLNAGDTKFPSAPEYTPNGNASACNNSGGSGGISSISGGGGMDYTPSSGYTGHDYSSPSSGGGDAGCTSSSSNDTGGGGCSSSNDF